MTPTTASRTSLDEVMADIEQTPTLPLEPIVPSGVVGLPNGGVTPVPSAEASVVMDTMSATATASVDSEVAPTGSPTAQQLWSTNLTPRQRRLPKIPYQMLGGFVAMLIFAMGLGSATYLTGRSQDVRNQAYEDTLPDIEGPLATETNEQYQARLQAQQQDTAEPNVLVETPFGPLTLMSGALLGAGAFLLIAFFIWFFVV